MRPPRPFRLALATAAAALLALPVRAETVTIFAAASLKSALDEVAAAYEAQSEVDLLISYAGSSALARQIEAGAPADIFISANEDWMDRLEAAGLIVDGSRRPLLSNRLVLVAAADRQQAFELESGADLVGALQGGKLAMALVDAVPAGIYGKAALGSLGMWETAGPHVAQADNVRAALAFVSTGQAPLGIVYASDALAEPAVQVLATFPEDSHPPILYPAALIEGAPAAAGEVLDHLASAPARAAFLRWGFAPPDARG